MMKKPDLISFQFQKSERPQKWAGDPREHRNEINLYLISRNVGRNDHDLLSDSAQ